MQANLEWVNRQWGKWLKSERGKLAVPGEPKLGVTHVAKLFSAFCLDELRAETEAADSLIDGPIARASRPAGEEMNLHPDAAQIIKEARELNVNLADCDWEHLKDFVDAAVRHAWQCGFNQGLRKPRKKRSDRGTKG